MILMWLGSFVLMMFGLSTSQKYAAEFFAGLQKKFFDKGLDTNLGTMFIRAADVVLLETSPQKSLYAGMGLYNLRVLALRPSTLVMCLSTLGAWWVLILGFLFMSFNGLFLMGLCSLMFLSPFVSVKVDKVLKWIFFTGLFLLGGEIMLRNSSILQSTLGESDLVFFLADGRFPAMLGLLLAGIVLSLIVQIEFWTLALGLSLLFTNVLSLNGAIGLLAGERIGRMLLFWWHTRSLNQDCRRLGTQFAVVSSLGAFVGLVMAGVVRETVNLGYSTGMASFQDKSLQFMMLFIVILLFQFIAQMIWGHFAVQFKVDEMQEPKYISKSWFRPEFFSTTSMAWAKGKVHKRLSEIRYHVAGLGTLKEGQVPEHIQARLKAEEEQLTVIEKLF
ncbi:hypothetical protein [Bdellovibrio svalbardensis]|uniref:Uncharacterized protein n=1 Tax=Bdellovibrio svalbardensis TaxID=2972972 RepID=A0ABT6DPC5_9BACT|nr:hypothetical protein [Bdellovibrio svalbardensis]MDG0816993.1 hypothetical protein [Bdellovibrio svalbardensis]